LNEELFIATKVVVGVVDGGVGFVNHNRLIGACLELKILKSLLSLLALDCSVEVVAALTFSMALGFQAF
jgi:hypothetical protein